MVLRRLKYGWVTWVTDRNYRIGYPDRSSCRQSCGCFCVRYGLGDQMPDGLPPAAWVSGDLIIYR